jgi:hypothetical protein
VTQLESPFTMSCITPHINKNMFLTSILEKIMERRSSLFLALLKRGGDHEIFKQNRTSH